MSIALYGRFCTYSFAELFMQIVTDVDSAVRTILYLQFCRTLYADCYRCRLHCTDDFVLTVLLNSLCRLLQMSIALYGPFCTHSFADLFMQIVTDVDCAVRTILSGYNAGLVLTVLPISLCRLLQMSIALYGRFCTYSFAELFMQIVTDVDCAVRTILSGYNAGLVLTVLPISLCRLLQMSIALYGRFCTYSFAELFMQIVTDVDCAVRTVLYLQFCWTLYADCYRCRLRCTDDYVLIVLPNSLCRLLQMSMALYGRFCTYSFAELFMQIVTDVDCAVWTILSGQVLQYGPSSYNIQHNVIYFVNLHFG